MANKFIKLWSNKEFYTPTSAAFLWLNELPKAPEDIEGTELYDAIEDTYNDLRRYVAIVIKNPYGKDTRVEPVNKRPYHLSESFKGISYTTSESATPTIIHENKNNSEPHWGYTRDDLIAYAEEIGMKPLFLFCDARSRVGGYEGSKAIKKAFKLYNEQNNLQKRIKQHRIL